MSVRQQVSYYSMTYVEIGFKGCIKWLKSDCDMCQLEYETISDVNRNISVIWNVRNYIEVNVTTPVLLFVNTFRQNFTTPPVKPNMLQTTWAAFRSKLSSQTVPHPDPWRTSTRPSWGPDRPNRRTEAKEYRMMYRLSWIRNFVTSDAIRQWFSRVTKSLVKIIAVSSHEWQNIRYSGLNT